MSSNSQSRTKGSSHKIIINPNFGQGTETQNKSSVHINPRFHQKLKNAATPVANETAQSKNASTHSSQIPQAAATPQNVHINPNFAARPLPDLPNLVKSCEKKQCYVNPSFLDPSKAKAYDDNVKKVIESKRIFFNPKKFQPTPVAPKAVSEKLSPGSSSEKENMYARRKAAGGISHTATTSHCKKSLFKKIGTRKLIRVKSSSNSSKKNITNKNNSSVCVEKINSPIVSKSESSKSSKFRKIGNKKLVRVKSVGLLTTPPLASSGGRYKLKTNRKIIVKTPRSLFSTPFSLKKKRVISFQNRNSPSPKVISSKSSKYFGNRFSNMFSPFKVDRRVPITPAMTPKLTTVVEQKPSSFEQKVKSHSKVEESYKKPVPPKPARKGPSTTLINVQGVRYTVSDNGRKLNRVEARSDAETPKNAETPKSVGEKSFDRSSAPTPTPSVDLLPRKLYLDGEEYIEDEPGVLIRSRNSMTRQSITSYKNRSINTILKSQTRSKQYCMFYNKFGKCNKRDKGMCPYIHDVSKVAVCRKFLQANCHNDKCLLSHQVAPDKMPSCKFFMQGLCTRDPCPYRHVHVNSDAEVCPDFLKGFCPARSECKKKHFLEKNPEKITKEFENEKSTKIIENENLTNEIENEQTVIMREKKMAPAKPKRKSLCATPMSEKKARVRYYDEKQEEPVGTQDETGNIQFEQDQTVAGDKSALAGEQSFSPSLEEKRKRLLRKVELAKQGWTGMAIADLEKTGSEHDLLDDSGPYEEILDDYLEKKVERAPVGRLPSYISLDSTKNLEECDLIKNSAKSVQSEKVEIDMEGENSQKEFNERLI